MGTEVSCGQCHERLLIETPGVVVACPHCGVHLSIPVPEIENVFHPSSALSDDQNESATSLESTPLSPPPDPPDPTEHPGCVEPSASALPDFSWMAVTPDHSLKTTPPSFDTSPFVLVPEGTVARSSNETSPPVSPQSSVSAEATAFASEETDSRQAFLVMLLVVIGSYASLLTIYLTYVTFFGRTHQLESLPDLKTVQQQGGRAAVPRPENDLPPGHELRLGQSQRYGNIRVTPLRVTRGPISFTHFSGDATRERPASEPVLKLWLKFENVSSQQTIVPIDTTLMFFRRGMGDVVAYNVIFHEADRKNKKALVFYNFDRLAADSEWKIVGQHSNEPLAPSKSYETFVPSEENIEGLSGHLVWRVHVRKGYGPKSENGVTTLIDVRFNADDIEPESA